ncbi:MAG: uncharacterized protein KVP18_001190 [Porospora cf. gigantea A]|uniref:uncharacterized protein n=1 Tax=Porospora cf. gigantea A TaxID=2853593 RepID=UPI0035599163|nr:MAG: hypothetical protein KVP18_001190 [Porospora cf. gigantea A]
MADLDLEEYDELEDDYWNLDENMGAPKMTDEAQYDDWNVGENTLAPTITDDDFFESGFSEKPAEMIPVADDFLSGWNNVNAYVGDPEAEPEQYVEDLHTDEFAEEFHSPADYCAEVVTIHTTMSGLPLKYFESIRIRHLLNCKGIPYTLINTNKEFSSAMNLMDLDLLEEWKAAALLSLDPVESSER